MRCSASLRPASVRMVCGRKLNKVVEQIRGPKGTEVRLTVIPAAAADSSERKIVTIIREEIKLEESAAQRRSSSSAISTSTANAPARLSV